MSVEKDFLASTFRAEKADLLIKPEDAATIAGELSRFGGGVSKSERLSWKEELRYGYKVFIILFYYSERKLCSKDIFSFIINQF